MTSIGNDSASAMVWIVSKRHIPDSAAASTAARLRVYQAVMTAQDKAPIQIASFPVSPFEKFVPPGVGPDEVFVAGLGHIEGFGIR